MAKNKKQNDGEQQKKSTPRVQNRKAWHDYHIIEKVEAGLELTGTEVKALRLGLMKIDESYARIDGSEVFLVGANIAHYPQAAEGMQHVPTRKRKCLLHRRQIEALQVRTAQKGLTIVPLAVYFKNGWAKVELGLAEGKQNYDKRQALKEKTHKRDMDRALRWR